MISVKDFQNELKRWCIHYEAILEDNPELEAQLILIASNNDSDLRYKLEERAAIRQADGLPGDLLSAALSYIQR